MSNPSRVAFRSRRYAASRAVAAVVVIALTALAGGAYFYAQAQVTQSSQTGATRTATSTAGSAASTAPLAGGTAVVPINAVQVVIPAVDGEPGSDGTDQFNPQVITIVIGVNNTVTWINHDEFAHNILTTSGFSSPDLSTGQTFTYIFTQPGTYHYSCSYFPVMSGTVIVKNPKA
jgi:plastocyanin